MPLRRLKRFVSEWTGLRRCTYSGRPFYFPASSLIGRQLSAGNGWDEVLVPILLSLVEEEKPIVIEVGSNIGASLLQIKLAKPFARVICFEPSSRFLPALLKNIEANEWRDVTVETVLVSDQTNTLVLHNNATTASVAGREYDTHVYVSSEQHQAMALDTYCANLDRLDFLKVDTDGHEFEVFRGAEASLRRLRPLLFFELADYMLRRLGHSSEALLSLLAELGYRDLLAFDEVGKFIGLGQTTGEMLAMAANQHYIDVVAAHRDRTVQVAALLAMPNRK